MVWYVYGPDGINKYFVTKLGGEPRTFLDGVPNVHDALVNNASGLLGRFMNVIMNVVFPYIILGSLFGKSAGGKVLIKLAFRWTRNLRGGPAHAAIVSSAMFGTISGGPVVNVLSTGVLTIPMMIKRGFSKVFAGGMEAAASSGGSIMPPVMGVAAFVLAAMTAVPYREVIIAAALPALAYFLAYSSAHLFNRANRGSRHLGVYRGYAHFTHRTFAPVSNRTANLANLAFVADAQGFGGLRFPWLDHGADVVMQGDRCSVSNLNWGMQIFQNAAGDAGATGWWAAALVMVLLFLDKEFRQQPRKMLDALAEAGLRFQHCTLCSLRSP